MALYLFTMAPTVTLEDSGELIVAAEHFGVPHPPGYPIWTLVNAFFIWVFRWVRYFGEPDTAMGVFFRSLRALVRPAAASGVPNPAWGVHFASALFRAWACALTTRLIVRSGAALLRRAPRLTRGLDPAEQAWACGLAGMGGGLLLAASPVLWSQSVIAEVYSLNAFFQALILLLLFRWMERPADRRALFALAFAFGLGLTNHQTLLFMGPALALAVLVRETRLFGAFVLAGLSCVLVVAFNAAAARAGLAHWHWAGGPQTPAFWVHTALFLAGPVAALFTGPRGRTAGMTFLLVFLGVSFYLYLPIASARNPPMNWGYARTWEGFLHLVTRGQYEEITPARVFSPAFLRLVGAYLADLRVQFTLPILLIGFLPFCAWHARVRGRRIDAWRLALPLVLGVALLMAPERALSGQPGLPIVVAAYRILAGALMLLAGIGTALLLLGLHRRLRRAGRRGDRIAAGLGHALAAALVLGPAVTCIALLHMALRGDLRPEERILAGLLAILPPMLLFLAHRARRRPIALRFTFDADVQTWLLATVVGFVSVSFVFIVFQNLPLNVLTLFVGRVQFIQSHAFYALWLGLGLLVILAVLAGRWSTHPARHPALAALTLALPLVLLADNAFNPEQLATIGAAEQRRHDFGWIFGDGLLRGEAALRHSLGVDDPADWPTPGYPPPLAPNAIYFGGTDPGRFVPTYMVFSARVRPDVFVLTQTALADSSYLRATRDFYGHRIRLPDRAARLEAFRRHLEEAARAEANGDPAPPLSEPGERMSVSGVEAVTAINAILSRMIFDANRDRHAFYVEEGYRLPWMVDYLEPHGLIMRLHPEPRLLSPERIREDQAFWAWLTGRLLARPAFRRDLVARMAFSKLRSSLARLYDERGFHTEAERAFLQARDLHPASPEATYRLADLYLRQERFFEARRLLEDLVALDPLNRTTRDYLTFVRHLAAGFDRRAELDARRAAGTITPGEALDLAQIHLALDEQEAFETLVRQRIADPGGPADESRALLPLAALAVDAGRLDLTEALLLAYLVRAPDDTAARMDLASVRLLRGDPEGAIEDLRAAVRQGGAPIRQALQADPRFAPLRDEPDFRRLAAPALQ